MSTVTPATDVSPKMKMHWHVLFTHFPASLFGVAFGFQFLHLFTSPGCFDLASNITLITGAVVMIPTTLTGWFTWKSRYKGARVPLFKRKITIAFCMLAYSIVLVVWRLVFYDITSDLPNSSAHWIYLIATGLLPLGAFAEGYYGGKLNHR
jgi:uncharacterized membrane protein